MTEDEYRFSPVEIAMRALLRSKDSTTVDVLYDGRVTCARYVGNDQFTILSGDNWIQVGKSVFEKAVNEFDEYDRRFYHYG
jgi:hypothetical protein